MTPSCPLFQDPACRFCSHEHLLVPYAPLVLNEKTQRLEPGSTKIRKEALGAFCNNLSQWVRDLKYCPARWGLHGAASTGVRADGCGGYKDDYGQFLIPRDDEFVVIGVGQQVLMI